MKITKSWSIPVAALFATLSLSAQNRVKNPDFDAGTSAWTLGATLRQARIAPSTVSGRKSPALHFEHVVGTAPASIGQILSLEPGSQRLRFFAGTDLKKGCSVSIRASLHNARTNRLHLSGNVYLQNRSGGMLRVEKAFDLFPKFAITKDAYRLTIDFGVAGPTFQRCTCDLDRVELLPARMPITSLDKVESRTGNPATLSTRMTDPGMLVIQYLSAQRLLKSVVVPGITGALEIDPNGVIIIPAPFRSGLTRFTRLPEWPMSLRQKPFYAQSLSIDSKTFELALGSSTWHCIR